MNQKEAEFAAAFGTMQSRARDLARYRVFYGDANLINTELDRYRAVKREDLQRVAKKYLTPEGVNILRFPVPKSPDEKVAPVPNTTPAAEPATAQ
jgi:predicted Zn-dependent peptidase